MLKSILASIVDLFHPRILLLIFVPPVLSLILWVVLSWLFWDRLGELINLLFLTNASAQNFLTWLQDRMSVPPQTVGSFISLVLTLITLFPLTWITALLIGSVTATPVVLSHLQKHDYPNLEKKRGGNLLGSIGNAFIAGLFFAILWIMTVPFWVLPGVGWMIPLILTGMLHQRVFWFEMLADHASVEERQKILTENRFELFGLGLFLAFLITIPLVNFLVPVFGALVFGRYCLQQLQKIRNS